MATLTGPAPRVRDTFPAAARSTQTAEQPPRRPPATPARLRGPERRGAAAAKFGYNGCVEPASDPARNRETGLGEIDLACDWAADPTRRAVRGAASELLACAALMKAGYHVYRSESPTAPFDLVAYRDGRCLRVEVKSVTEKAVSCAPVFGWPRNKEWDLLVAVGLDRVFCFDSDTTWEDARNAIRESYGHQPLGESNVAVRPCGTEPGYKLHLLRNEDPDACPWCSVAHQRLRDRRRVVAQTNVLRRVR